MIQTLIDNRGFSNNILNEV